MTKRKTDKPKKKRHNITRHDRAMADTKVRADFDALKSNWPSLSEPEQGERLRKLDDSGCTVRGLGRDLGQPPTTLRNRMKQAVTSEANSDWSAMLDTIAPRESKSQRVLSSIEAARESKAEFQRNRAIRPANAQKDQATEVQPASKAQPTITSRVTPISARKPPIVNDGPDGKEISAEDPSKKNPLEQLKLTHRKREEKIRGLASIDVEPRPIRDARSLRRQGKP